MRILIDGNLMHPSQLFLSWVQWPGGGPPWPVGYYLGVSRANERQMWLTVSPLSGTPIRMHIPEDARLVEGPFPLEPGYFPPMQPKWLDFPYQERGGWTHQQELPAPCSCELGNPDDCGVHS